MMKRRRYANAAVETRYPATETKGGGGLLSLVFFGAAGFLMLSSAIGGVMESSELPVSAAQSEESIRFIAQGRGYLVADAGLSSNPETADSSIRLSAGTEVQIGGMVTGLGSLRQHRMFWVQVDESAGGKFGFLPEDKIEVIAGYIPRLDLRGVPAEMLLAPATGVSRGLGRPLELQAQSESAARQNQVVDISWLPESVSRFEDLFIEAGQRHGVDPELVAIITLVESGGRPDAQSHAGAMGLMQVMPGTAADIANRRGMSGFDIQKLWEPETNIDFGAWYLAEQLRNFGRADDPDWKESVLLAATAYNGGPGTAQRYLQGQGIPNETKHYQEWVSGMWQERNSGDSGTLARWMSAGGQVLVQAAQQQMTASY